MSRFYFTKVLLLSLSLFLAGFLQAQEIIPMEILPSGHIMLKARVNGIEGNFIFDTGAGITILTKKFSEKLQNVEKQDGMLTAFRATGEKIDAELFTVDDISIGKLAGRKPTVTIFDLDIPGCDGILSLIPFQHQPFTLDLKNKLFILESPESLLKRRSGGKSVDLLPERDRGLTLDIFASFLLNGQKTLRFLLDSGAGNDSFWINSRYMASCGIDVSDTSAVKKIVRQSEFNPAVKTEFYKASVPALSLKSYPEIHVENFKTTFTPDLIYDGKVSVNWLGEQLTFDLENEQLIIAE